MVGPLAVALLHGIPVMALHIIWPVGVSGLGGVSCFCVFLCL